MDLQRTFSRYSSLIGFIGLLWVREVWEFHLSHNLHPVLVECVVAPISLVSFFLFFGWAFKKIEQVPLTIVLVGIGSSSAICWTSYSKVLSVILALLAMPIAIVLLKSVIAPTSEERQLTRRARTEILLADRDLFERSWQRRIKVTEGIFVLFCALMAIVCWSNSFRTMATLLALLGAFFLIGTFATLIPMSDEKFEERLAKAKALHERAQARRARFAARRLERAEKLETQKNGKKRDSRSQESFSAFISSSLLICLFWFQDRSALERPDLVFLAMPAWFLIRAIYFFIRERKHPMGPDAPFASEPPISGLGN